MSGTLFVVATPIGNLEDITLRAMRVLREVDLIAAEDTRHTAKLLAHFAIATPTLSFHEHNTRARIPQIIDRLESGESVALVSDAGTPGVSDPGVELVRACVSRGIAIDPIPGASAPLTAAIASGFPLEPLMIYGFAPARSKDRTTWFDEVAAANGTVTFFEAPHRIEATLREAAQRLGNRPIVVARELTKVHQEFVRGTAADIIGRLPTVRGEFTVVIGPRPPERQPSETPSDAAILAEFGRMAELATGSRRDAVTAVAKKLGTSSREVYAAVERAKRDLVNDQ